MRGVGIERDRPVERKRDLADVVGAQGLRALAAAGIRVDALPDRLDRGGDGRGAELEEQGRAGAQGLVLDPEQARVEALRDDRRRAGGRDDVAARGVEPARG